LPLDVSEIIPEDHICNLVEEVVDSMGVGEVEPGHEKPDFRTICIICG